MKLFARRKLRGWSAFSLLEVMIASGIFFMAAFAVLALVSQSLRGARALQRPPIDAGMAAAIFTATNRFYEGRFSGDFDDKALRDYSWEAEVYEVGTNGLLGIDVVLLKRGMHKPFDQLSTMVFDPNYKSTPHGSTIMK